jgi:hypothetical protein
MLGGNADCRLAIGNRQSAIGNWQLTPRERVARGINNQKKG